MGQPSGVFIHIYIIRRVHQNQLNSLHGMGTRRLNHTSMMHHVIAPSSSSIIIIISIIAVVTSCQILTGIAFTPTTTQVRSIPMPFTTSKTITLMSATDDAFLSPTDFSLTDFTGLDDMDRHHTMNDDNDIDQNLSNDIDATTDDETTLFLQLIEDTPHGQLQEYEIETLRDILSSYRDQRDQNDAIDRNTVLTVERLLLRWVEEYTAQSSLSSSSAIIIPPCTQDFVVVMQLWEQLCGLSHGDRIRIRTTELPVAMEHIKTLLSVLKECYHHRQHPSLTVPSVARQNDDDFNIALKPTIDVYRIVLRSLSYSSERQIDRKGEKLFQEMQSDYQIQPDASTYESLIYMLAKSRNDGAAHRAERLLREALATLQQQSHSDGNRQNYIGVDTFNVVITAWAKSGIEYGPERAEQLIHLMSESGNLEPNIHSFTSLIDAYAQQNTWDSATQCERIFNRVLDLYLNNVDEKSFEPSIVSWSVVVSAWGRLAKDGRFGASERADKVVRRMETLFKEGRISYGPDPILYIKCMNANACSQTTDGLKRATQIINDMYERYLDGDDSSVPTARSIHILIDNWIRSQLPNKMDEAESIFNMYKDQIIYNLPEATDTKTQLTAIYKSMVIGWAHDGDPILAQECLEEMIEKDLTPESICFEKIIDSNTQLTADDHQAMKRSYAVFQLLEECRMKRADFVPSERAYTSFIRAMTKSRVPNLSQKAYTILQKMEHLFQQGSYNSIMPTVFTYNAVLLACAESASLTHNDSELHHREALRTAVTVFNQLRQGTTVGLCDLDNVSCGNMLRCSNLLPADLQKDEFITSIFQLCCERGLVNYFILRDLFLVASDELVEKLLGSSLPLNDTLLENLPSSWQRNANMKKASVKPASFATKKDSFQRGDRRSRPFQSKRR